MRLHLFFIFAVAGAAVCTAVALMEPAGNEAPVAQSIRSSGRPDVFGPGILQAELPPPPSTFHPPNQATTDEKGNLIVDTALLQLFDYFLLQQGDDGAVELEQYLTTALPEPARQQGIDIARHYRAYMAEHDRQLAAQHADMNNLSRVSAWMEQRARLRMATIGDIAAKAWYQNDDAQLQQAVFELTSAQGAGLPREGIPGVPQWRDAEGATRHQRYLQKIVEKNLLSYAMRKTLEQRLAVNQSP